MSKQGKQRRTPEQRDEAKENRSSLAYIQRILRETNPQVSVSETEEK